MSCTVVMTTEIAGQLSTLADLHVESAAVLLARPVMSATGDVRLLVVEMHEVPPAAYEVRASDLLLVTSDGFVTALGRAAQLGAVPIWMHTHPGSDTPAAPSDLDHQVDAQLTDVFRLRADSPYYAALTVAQTDGQLRFTGHIDDGRQHTQINRVWIVGPHLTMLHSETTSGSMAEQQRDLHDRNIRAFGEPIQHALSQMHIVIAGCGGTGSAVAEQLVRLGVRHLTLIDPDTLTRSNLTRVYGSIPADVGRLKCDVLAEHLQTIAPDLQVVPVPAMLTLEDTAGHLLNADVIFGCTDDNAGRLVLSRAATHLLTPVIDCGVLLTSDADGRLDGVHGRVTVLHPGAACLICRGRIDLARAATEVLTPDERLRRLDEGYATALPGTEPAVVAYTTMIASLAVAELIEGLTGYGPDQAPNEVLLRHHEREVSTNVQQPTAGHYCDPTAGALGLGATEPFLGLSWPG
jgi:molybdopterin/thiamine biosynthesis adenylyltransferase